MASQIKDFYELDAWKEGHSLTLKIYKETFNFPKEEKYGLISQLRRATSSITANIAEGFGRFHYADKTRFYYQARGSLKEVQNFILLTRDLGYLKSVQLDQFWEQAQKVEKLINGLIRSINKQK